MCTNMCPVCAQYPQALTVHPSLLQAGLLSLLLLAAGYTISHQLTLQDPLENIFLKLCNYKKPFLLIFFCSVFGVWRGSVPLLSSSSLQSPSPAASPCLAEGPVAAWLCFHLLLPASSRGCAGWSLISHSVWDFFQIEDNYGKKEINFLL